MFDAQYFPYFWDKHLKGERVDDGAGHLVDPLDELRACLDIKGRAGITDVVCDLPDGTVYDADWITSQPDWTHGDIEPFRAMVRWLLAQGFRPIIYILTGEAADAELLYNGVFRLLVRSLKEFADIARWMWAWETVGAGSPIRAKANHDAIVIMDEELGPNACLGWHSNSAPPGRCTIASALGPVHDELGNPTPQPPRSKLKPTDPETWIEDDDPTEGEESAWATKAERRVARRGFWFHQGPPEWDRARWIEFLDRFLREGTPIPSLGRGAAGPDWFVDDVRPELCAGEPDGIPFKFIRGGKTAADIASFAAQMDADGIRSQGCLPAAE
ncbi:MAG: hypothetical protein ABI634_02675 [Acidobacteriota bacterium]